MPTDFSLAESYHFGSTHQSHLIAQTELRCATHAMVVVPGLPLHVIQRGNNPQAFFFTDQHYYRFHTDLRAAAQRFDCAIHAYVYMTNHVQLFVTPSARQGISRMGQSVGRRMYTTLTMYITVAAPCGRGVSSRRLLIQTDTCLSVATI